MQAMFNTITLRWSRNDAHRGVTWAITVVAAGLAGAAVVMAVVGLPPVDLHGPLHKVGIMDPLCGGTRAARYTAQGQLADAWRYNPLGILVVVGSALLITRSVIGLVGGRWLNLQLRLTPATKRVAWAIVALLVLLLEIRQQLRADLLMAGTQHWM